MEDWMLPSPSPRTLMPSFFSEEFSSAPFSNIFGDDRSNKPLDEIEKSKSFIGSSAQETSQDMKDHPQTESNLFGANQKSTSPGGLAERMAARAGFGVLKIDTSRVSSSGAPIRSPVTIPPAMVRHDARLGTAREARVPCWPDILRAVPGTGPCRAEPGRPDGQV